MSDLTPTHNLSELYSFFNEFRRQCKFYDIKIKIGDRSFSCHRIILASVFSYFREAFPKEANETEEIELDNVDAEDFELLLTYIYGDSVSLSDENRCYRLLKICHQLGFPSLKNSCVKHLIDNAAKIPFDTVLDIFIFATSIENESLVEKFIQNVADNLSTAFKHWQFVHIPEVYLLKILKHSAAIENCSSLLDFFAEWVQFQPCEQRVKSLSNLLKAANLDQVPSEWFLRTINFMSAAIPSNAGKNEFNKQLVDAVAVETFSPMDVNKEKECNKQNERNETPFVLYTLSYTDVGLSNSDKGNQSDCMRVYQYQNNQLKHLRSGNLSSKVPGPSYHRKTVLVDNIYYLIGVAKVVNGNCNEINYSFQCSTKKYFQDLLDTKISNYQFKKCAPSNLLDNDSLSIAVSGTNIYVYCDLEFVIFNCQTNEWAHMLEDGLVKTACPNLVSHNSSLYMVGGKNVSSATYGNNKDKFIGFTEINGKLFQRYDEREGKWVQLPRLTYARSKSASCVYNDILYVSGGDDLMYCKGYIEYFDFKAFKWFQFEASMPSPKLNHIFFGHNNHLWFFGGQKNIRNKKVGPYNTYPEKVQDMSWYSYSLEEHAWSDIVLLPLQPDFNNILRILDVVVDTRKI